MAKASSNLTGAHLSVSAAAAAAAPRAAFNTRDRRRTSRGPRSSERRSREGSSYYQGDEEPTAPRPRALCVLEIALGEGYRASAVRRLTETREYLFDSSSSSAPPSPRQPFTFLFFLTSSRYESKYCHRIWRLHRQATIARGTLVFLFFHFPKVVLREEEKVVIAKCAEWSACWWGCKQRRTEQDSVHL